MNNKNLVLKKQTLVNIADAIREKTGSVELIAIEDLDEAVASLQIGAGGNGGGIIEVDELQGPYLYTPVPNSGYVEKVCLDTSLSIEQVVAELQKLTYSEYGDYPLLINDNILLLALTQNGIYLIVDDASGMLYFASEDPSGVGQFPVGWNPDFNGEIEVNAEVTSEMDGNSIGAENDKIANLLYLTKQLNSNFIPNSVYKVTKRPVPVQGEVKNIYFNSNLSIPEVNSILSTLDYDYKDNTAYIVAGVGGRTIEVWRFDDGFYEIQESAGSAGWFEIFNSEEGWVRPYLSEFIYDGVVLEPIHWDEFYCGLQNEKLKELISIDDFYIDHSISNDHDYTHFIAARDLTIKSLETDGNMYISVLPDCRNLSVNSYNGFMENYAFQKEIAPNGSVKVFAAGVVGLIDDYGKDIQCIKNCYSIHVDDGDNTHDGLTLVILTGRDALVHIKNMEM